jgi:hypothetical protein
LRKTFWRGWNRAASAPGQPPPRRATTCTITRRNDAQDRQTLASAGQLLGNAVVQQDFSAIQYAAASGCAGGIRER